MEILRELDDKELVNKAQTGNKKAIEVLYERYINKIYGKCLNLTKNSEQAKDLAHDIFIKIYTRLHSYGGVSNFSSWVYAITYNHCMSALSGQNRRRQLEEDSVEKEDYILEENLQEELKNLRIQQLREAIPKLAIEEQTILLMRYQDGLSIKEIMNMLKLSESATKMRLKRSRTKLAKYVKQIANEG